MDVCKVQFRKVGKKYFFNPNGIEVKDKDLVVVETVRGIEIGEIVGGLVPCNPDIEKDIKPILRIATKKDIDTKRLEHLVKFIDREFDPIDDNEFVKIFNKYFGLNKKSNKY